MPKKKSKQKELALDLHGIKHLDVDRIVENYVFLTPYPHNIITGNSDDMLRIAKDVLDRHKFKYEVGDPYNLGYIKVLGYE